jgi:KDO2-lipid IV(A) lauroyltransferase
MTIVTLAKRYNARISTAFLFRRRPGDYLVYFEPIDDHLSVEQILQTYNQRLEQLIRLYPEQWVWFHKRWRTQGGKRLSSSQYMAFLEQVIKDRERQNIKSAA